MSNGRPSKRPSPQTNSTPRPAIAPLAGEARPDALAGARLSTDCLELAHELVGIGSYLLNLRTRTLYISREMALLLGAGDAPFEMPIEEYRRRFFAPDNHASTSTAAEQAYDAGRPLWLDAHIIRADGRSIWVRTASILRTNEAGDPVRVGMLRDITDQREAFETVAQSERQLREQAESLKHMALVMEHANDAILLLTEDGRILEANRRAVEFYGYSLDELRGLTIADLRDPSTWSTIPELLKAAGTSDGAVFETLHRRKDGTSFPVEINSRLVEIEGKRWRLSVIRDITQRREHEAQLARLNRLYAAVTQINRAVATAVSRDELFLAVCRLLVDISRFKMVWVGWTSPTTRLIEPVAQWGDDGGYLASIKVSADDRPEGWGPTGQAVREGRVCVISDIVADPRMALWREAAVRNGFRASIALPIRQAQQIVGALNVYASEPNIFTEKEISLCNEAVEAIAFALQKFETERLRAQAEVRQLVSDERLRVAFMTGPDGYVILGRDDGRFFETNDRMVELFGYSREEMIGRTTLELNMWVDPDARKAVIDGINAAGRVRDLEVHARRKNGETFWVSYSACILAIEGTPLLMGVVHDITEEKRAADALRHAEEKYRSIYENAVEGMFRTTPDGRCIAGNPAAARLLGYSSPEEAIAAIGDTRLQVWADPAVRDHYVARLEQEEIVRGFECQLRRRDGSLVWVALSTRRVAGPTGKTLYYDGFMEDISERRQAEAELREAEELYRGIFEGAAEGIYRAALNDRISAANTTMARILGYDSPAQMIEAAAAHPVPPWWLNTADRNRLVRLLETQGRVSNFESQLRRRDGTLIWAMISARLVKGTDGRPLHYEGFITDITEKRRLEEQFLRVQRLENIGMLAAGIAHDLNNVLAPIGMAAQLLRLRHTDPTDLRILSMLEASAGRGAGLVRQILGFARGVSGAPQLVQVKHLLRDLVEIIRETFPKSIVLEQSIARDLWPVMANPTQLHQVLLNLCVNARDAIPNGGTLRLSAENQTFSTSQAAAIDGARPGNWVVLHVKDSGTGMPPEVAARIWEPFFTTKSEGKGTGLGLPTVRGIVETHGGFITLETEVGRGTSFHVHLPAAESTPETADDGTTATPSQGNGEKILFADDESTIREMVADTLTILGYVAVVAANGAQAIELFRTRPDEYALVVTDLEMPVTNGRAFAQMVRALRPQLKILAASGLEKGSPELRWQEFADDYLQKPFTAGELVAAVQKLLRPTINGTNSQTRRSGTAQPFAGNRG